MTTEIPQPPLQATLQTGTDDAARSAYDALSPKHKAFVDTYCKCWNGRIAAVAAGYSDSSATSYAYLLLKRDDIKAAIEEWKERTARRAYAVLQSRHKAFLDAYCLSWNASQAAVAAGYRFDEGAHLLRRDDILAALTERQALVAASKEVEISEVVGTLTQVLRGNMLDYISIDPEGEVNVDFARLTRDQAAVISELKVETCETRRGGKRRREVSRLHFKLHDKLRAAEKLLRHLGAVTPKVAEPAVEVAKPAREVTDLDRAKAILHLLAKVKKRAEAAGTPWPPPEWAAIDVPPEIRRAYEGDREAETGGPSLAGSDP
jgi:phage terminase small subunit